MPYRYEKANVIEFVNRSLTQKRYKIILPNWTPLLRPWARVFNFEHYMSGNIYVT